MGNADNHIEEIEALYRRHGAALLLFASTISRDRHSAQDAVHRVFLNLMESGRLRQARDKKSFLFACVRNAALNDSKLRNRNTPLDLDSVWFHPPDRDYAAEQNLRRALNGLPDDQREVVVLHVWGELTFSEIGELLEVSANTAASRYRYALAKLRDSMVVKEDFCANPQ